MALLLLTAIRTNNLLMIIKVGIGVEVCHMIGFQKPSVEHMN